MLLWLLGAMVAWALLSIPIMLAHRRAVAAERKATAATNVAEHTIASVKRLNDEILTNYESLSRKCDKAWFECVDHEERLQAMEEWKELVEKRMT